MNNPFKNHALQVSLNILSPLKEELEKADILKLSLGSLYEIENSANNFLSTNLTRALFFTDIKGYVDDIKYEVHNCGEGHYSFQPSEKLLILAGNCGIILNGYLFNFEE